MHKKKAVLVLLLCLSMAACSDNRLESVAKGLNEAATTVGILQTTVIEAERQALVTTEQARTILEASIKVNQAGLEAVEVARTVSRLDTATQVKLMAILPPMIGAVNNLVQNGTAGITDQATKDKIQLLLVSLQAILNAVQLSVAGGA